MSNLLLFQDRYPDEDANSLARFHSGHYQFVGFVQAVDVVNDKPLATPNNLVGARPMGVSDILVDPEKMTLIVVGRKSLVEFPFAQSARVFQASSPFKG